MSEYVFSGRVKALAEALIEKMPEFEKIRESAPAIAYLEADKKKHSHGEAVYGDCEKVKPKMREFMAYDYIITVYTPNCEALTVNQWKLLLYHELLHIDCERSESGELLCRIRPHNIQDFHEITDRFGTYWDEDDSVPDIMEGIE